jgi:hypothetical protein
VPYHPYAGEGNTGFNKAEAGIHPSSGSRSLRAIPGNIQPVILTDSFTIFKSHLSRLPKRQIGIHARPSAFHGCHLGSACPDRPAPKISLCALASWRHCVKIINARTQSRKAKRFSCVTGCAPGARERLLPKQALHPPDIGVGIGIGITIAVPVGFPSPKKPILMRRRAD